ncbi:hypothetical protein I4U23_005997 [Adineta vaga]|nr:hypothetical protein I4U23_005997 [Adineta vaga]
MSDRNMQKSNIYNRYSPFYETIQQQSFLLFEEIRENLSRTIQSGEFEPGFSVWSKNLQQFISLYGFNFTKTDHLKLIHFYLSILSITDLNYRYIDTCFDVLGDLLRKTRLITRDDLIIDWRILYHWAQVIFTNKKKIHAVTILPKNIDVSMILCLRNCSPYFSATATQEILDLLRPQICPLTIDMYDTVKMFTMFLPTNLPSDLHQQGFKLWLSEFFTIWDTISNRAGWESRLIELFSSVAWNNIGYINWEPWLLQIFTRILRGFSLPCGKMQMSSQRFPYFQSDSAKWIVAMIGNESACLQYLRDLFISIRSFYHPSNTGTFQKYLVEFVFYLTKYFVDRIHLERKAESMWNFAPLQSHRLTEQDIIEFVHCVKDYAFISIFNKDYAEKGVESCQYLSLLRPELIIPMIVEKHFSSIDSITEPHRFTSIMKCLTHISRQIVQQTTTYSQGQIYVLPLLMSVLPGIDLNDWKKTFITFEFLDTILMMITCVDCSSAINTRNDLTEIEKQVCLSTRQFDDFIDELFHRISHLIEILQTDISDAVEINTNIDVLDKDIMSKMTSIICNIVQQCSKKIYQKVREKILTIAIGWYLSPKVRSLVCSLVRGLMKGNPIETLEYFMSKTCESIEKIWKTTKSTGFLIDHEEDIELNWYLNVFMELVRARGDTLLSYRSMIMSVFHQCIPIMNKKSYGIVADAAKYLLGSLTKIYPIDSRLTRENLDEPFVDCLPIRLWGQYVDYDQLHVQFHIPNEDEISFASDFVETFLYPELNLLNEKISNHQRLKSVTLIQSIVIGCFRMIPPIDNNTSIVSDRMYSKYRMQNLIQPRTLNLKENLRMRLFIDIGKFLDTMLNNHSDDVLSITTALRIYTSISLYYGIFEPTSTWRKDFLLRKKLLKNKLCNEGRKLRCLMIENMALRLKEIQLSNFGPLTDIDEKILLKLFDFSINRYSQIRSKSQMDLFFMLTHYSFSFEIIIDRFVQLFNTHEEVDHDQIKGCLYILLRNTSYFLPTKYSWTMREKLWPLIIRMAHTTKLSTKDLIEEINKKLSDELITDVIKQTTNELSVIAAINLWHSLESNEIKTCEDGYQADFKAYTNLMETLVSLLRSDTITAKQQKMIMSLIIIILQKQMTIPVLCIDRFLDFLIHENVELRKCAATGIITFFHFQKFPRIFVEKSLENLVHPEDHPGDRDDNLWVTIDSYKPPESQIEWEETCFLDKSFHGYYTWPKMIRYALNKRERYTQNNMSESVAVIYNRFINKDFVNRMIQMMIFDEVKEEKKKFDKTRFTMFKSLFRDFGLAFVNNFLEQISLLIHEKSEEKFSGSHCVAAEIVAGMIHGSKYWSLEMLNEFWNQSIPILTEVCMNVNFETRSYWDSCCIYSMRNQDPRRMYHFIDFLKTLMNTSVETSRWLLYRNLYEFGWRIPSIWCEINKQTKTLIDYSSSDIRERVATLLALSISYDVTLFNGKSTRHPSVNQLIDELCERLHQAIEIYEKTPLMNISDKNVEINPEVRKALDLIETVIEIHSSFFLICFQPSKDEIIRLFPYLCEIESIAANDILKKDLKISRSYVGRCYLNRYFFEALVNKLTEISTNIKWHARQVAIEFIQNLIFSNLFIARSYAEQIHQLVVKCLFDEQLDVRIAASRTLSGLYQCGYIQVTIEDLEHFRSMSEINYYDTITDGKKVVSSKNMISRHGGVLGLCAIVLASPYDIPNHIPKVLMQLCSHSHDPDLIQRSIKKCVSDFRRTHHDAWYEHRQQFTDDQLVILADTVHKEFKIDY